MSTRIPGCSSCWWHSTHSPGSPLTSEAIQVIPSSRAGRSPPCLMGLYTGRSAGLPLLSPDLFELLYTYFSNQVVNLHLTKNPAMFWTIQQRLSSLSILWLFPRKYFGRKYFTLPALFCYSLFPCSKRVTFRPARKICNFPNVAKLGS